MRFRYCFYLLILLAFSACVRPTGLDAGEEPQIVVDCVLNESSLQKLRLFYTKGASKREAPQVEDAEVVLIDMTDGEAAGLFSRVGGEDWELSYAPIVNHLYRLEINVPGREPVYAEQIMPGKGITNLHAVFSSTSVPGKYLSFGVQYVYFFSLSVTNCCWVYGLNYNPATGKREIAEEICTDNPTVDSFNLSGALFSPSGREAGPSALLDEAALHKRYLRFPRRNVGEDRTVEEMFNEDYFIVSGSFTGEYFCEQKELSDTLGIVQAMFVSDEYDRFLREVMLMSELQDSSDLADIFLRTKIYSNVQGGLGLFGACNTYTLRWYRDNTLPYFD